MMRESAVTNAMTVDVEDYFHVSAFAGAIDKRDWSTLEYRAEGSTGRLLELFADRGVRATFFVLGWVAARSPQLLRRIQAAGHEIACHGLEHELVYRQSREVFRRETAESRDMIEQVVGAPVLGYRAASYSITRESLWALDVLCELGFAYDSSIFPVRHDRYGIPDASRVPGLIKAPGGASIVEFPLSALRLAGMSVPVAGGGYFRLLPYSFTRWALRRINDVEGSPFIFYLHPWEIDPGQPRIRAGALSRFRHYTNLEACEARLKDLLSRFRFGSASDVLAGLGLLPAAPRSAPASVAR